MAPRRRSSDAPESARDRLLVRLAAALAGVAVAVAFGVAGLTLWTNSKRASDAAHLTGRVQAISQDTSRDAKTTTRALCALRTDLEVRVATASAFLTDHPHGIPGIPAKVVQDGIANQQRTIDALAGINCSR